MVRWNVAVIGNGKMCTVFRNGKVVTLSNNQS